MASPELPSSAPRPARAEVVALVSITALAIVLRLVGIGFLLPHQSEPDGVVYDAQVRILESGNPADREKSLFGYYPHLVARLATLVPETAVDARAPHTLAEHLSIARAHRLGIRVVVALLSVLAVPATWAIARRILAPRWALVAAFLQATSVFSIWFAQQARPHAVVTGFLALGVVAALRFARSSRWLDALFLAVATAAAVATLQNGLALALPIAAALAFHARRAPGHVALVAAAVIAFVALAVWAFYPFLFHDAPSAKGGIEMQGPNLRLSSHIVMLAAFNGRGFAYVARAFADFDPLLTVVALAGIALGALVVWRSRSFLGRGRELAVVLSFAVPYLVVFGLYQRTYPRFVLPLVPFTCVAAAGALAWASSRWRPARAIAVAICAVQLVAAARLVVARTRTDTISEAAAWISAHTEPGTTRVSVMPSLDLPLLQSRDAREANERANLDVAFPWFSYQWGLAPGATVGPVHELRTMPLYTDALRAAVVADPDAFVSTLGARYAVIEVFDDPRRLALRAIRSALARAGKLAVRISPDAHDRGDDLPILYQDDEFPRTDVWWWRILFARCVGPVIEIYELPER